MNKREGQGQKTKNMIFYFILIVMLVFSAFLYYEGEKEAVSAGSFGKEKNAKNVSFSDLKQKIKNKGGACKHSALYIKNDKSVEKKQSNFGGDAIEKNEN